MYQGTLEQGGSPVDTAVDVRFTLFDDAVAGAQVGSPVTVTTTPTDGVFSASVDFGALAFAVNKALFVEIEVSPQGLGTFELLGRQALEGAPYALNTRGITVDNSGNASLAGKTALFEPNTLTFNSVASTIKQNSSLDGTAENFLEFIDLPSTFNDSATLSGSNILNLSVNDTPVLQLRSSNIRAVRVIEAINGVFYAVDSTALVPGVPLASARFLLSEYTDGTGSMLELSMNDLDFSSSTPVANGAAMSFASAIFNAPDDYWGAYRTTPHAGNKFHLSYGGDRYVPNNPSAVVLTPALDVGLGTDAPDSKLDVEYSTGNGIEVTDTSSASPSIGVYATVGEGTGVRGESTQLTGAHYGVYGMSSSPSGWGVFSNGRFGAAGTKSFMIDHPLDPANMFLLHYSSESPEPQNRYNGNVILNNAGAVAVQLPDYFHAINSNYRYNLTAIGGPAPNLHIAQKIQGNVFVIAGGQPGQEISWEVIATRTDNFVVQRGAPVELEKVGHERGRFIMPELYGLPKDAGIHYVEPAEQINR
jgi:hypothetical protein